LKNIEVDGQGTLLQHCHVQGRISVDPGAGAGGQCGEGLRVQRGGDQVDGAEDGGKLHVQGDLAVRAAGEALALVAVNEGFDIHTAGYRQPQKKIGQGDVLQSHQPQVLAAIAVLVLQGN